MHENGIENGTQSASGPAQAPSLRSAEREPAVIDERLLAEYFALDAQVRELRRKASDLAKQLREREQLVERYARERFAERAAEHPVRILRIGRYVIEIVTKAGSVAWKTAFVRALGEAAAEAEIAAAEPVEELRITQA